MISTHARLSLAILLATSALITPLQAATYKGGVTERIRTEYLNNIPDFDDTVAKDSSYFRFRTSLWGQVDMTPSFSAYLRLVNENRAYLYREGGDTRYNINELVFDNLYVDMKDIMGGPLSLRVGRQDFPTSMYGEGFLIADGTPQDGSRTFYFDAAKATWKISKESSLDAFYISMGKYDDFLPVINEIKGRQLLNVSAVKGAALWHKTDAIAGLHWENFYIYRGEDGGGVKLFSQKSDINTVGTYARYAVTPFWNLKGQAACQFGSFGSNDRAGLGGYVFSDFSVSDKPMKPAAGIGCSYMSGDDPSTNTVESWDPLFGEGPLYSDLYYYSFKNEAGDIGYWTNVTAYRAYATLATTKQSKLSLFYTLLYANQSLTGNPVMAPVSSITATGKDRGRVAQTRFDYTFSKQVSAFVLGEYFVPGDFYQSYADPAIFVRTQVEMKF